MKLALLALLSLLGLAHSFRHAPSGLRKWHGGGMEKWHGNAAEVRSFLSRSKRNPERDLIREKAQANYNKVVEELNDRFRNYKENCFPRPKGCLCRTGIDRNGRDITERFRNDDDCKTTDPALLDSTRGVHDSRDRGGKKAPDYGQRGRDGGRKRRHHHRRH